MKILGIETTTEFFCIAAYDNGMIHEYTVQVGRRLSEIIDESIWRVLSALGWKIGDVDYFACGLGPGSFTGIRVGLATIKGICWALDRPVVGVSSLDILAMSCPHSGKIVPMLDARRGLIYCSMYELSGQCLKRVKPLMLLSKEDFFKKIKGEPFILGNAAGLYRTDIAKFLPRATILDPDYWRLKPRHIITRALEAIRRKDTSDTFNIQPIYLYPKECQVRI